MKIAILGTGSSALAGAAYGRDFSQANDLLDAIMPERKGVAALPAALSGSPALSATRR